MADSRKTDVDDKSDSKQSTKPSRRWVIPVVTTGIGVLFTVIFGIISFYNQAEETRSARVERIRSAESEMIRIIEEHIINKKSIELSTFERMIQVCERTNDLGTSLNARDLVERAEFNISNSRYLDFDKKQEFKEVFDGIYRQWADRSFQPLADSLPFSKEANEMARHIKEGSSDSALLNLHILLTNISTGAYASFSADNSEKNLDAFDTLRRLARDPLYLSLFLVYTCILAAYYMWRRIRRRRLYFDPGHQNSTLQAIEELMEVVSREADIRPNGEKSEIDD